jgi:hypothetical protein
MPSFDIPPRLQFSLRGMLIAVAVLAVLIWLSTAVAGLLLWVTWSLVYLLLPTPFVIAAVYTRGDIQAFAIGVLVPWVASWGSGRPGGGTLLSLIALALWFVVMGGICGIVAVASRRWLDRTARS